MYRENGGENTKLVACTLRAYDFATEPRALCFKVCRIQVEKWIILYFKFLYIENFSGYRISNNPG